MVGFSTSGGVEIVVCFRFRANVFVYTRLISSVASLDKHTSRQVEIGPDRPGPKTNGSSHVDRLTCQYPTLLRGNKHSLSLARLWECLVGGVKTAEPTSLDAPQRHNRLDKIMLSR